MDKILSIYWFVVLGIIATAIVIMVVAFYSSPYDIREIEARFLANKVADCVSSQGNLNVLLFESGSFKQTFSDNFLALCKITLNVEDTWGASQHYLGVEIYNITDQNNSVFNIEKGNLNFLPNCLVQESGRYKNLPKCFEARLYSIGEGKQFLIKILTAVGKIEKNVK